ncbi:MAG: carbohydrate ABC transporter permease [Anaerolineales bacterium]
MLTRWFKKSVGNIGIFGFILRWAVLLIFLIYFVIPIIWLLLAPSKDTSQFSSLSPLAFGSFAQYITAWKNVLIYQNGEVALWFGNSLYYGLLSLLVSLVLCLPAGYILAVRRFPGRNLLLWLTLITMLLPTSALVLPLFLELNLVHLVNTPWAVILPACFFPFGTYLTYIYYRTSLPLELIDAARVDGATEFEIFLHIALPLAKPLLGLLAFISFNANWNNYFGPYVMLNDDKLFTLPVGIQTVLGSTSALEPGFNPTPGAIHFQYAEAAVAGLILIVPVVIIFLLSQRYVVSGAFTGSVKG